MRKDKVWKQVLALVLSAALVVGNGTSVSAATGDPAADKELAGSTQTVTSPADGLAFGADGTMSADNKSYEEGGISFTNDGVEIVDAPIITDEDGQPATGETVTGDDGGHGKVFIFPIPDPQNNEKTGESWITTAGEALKDYDFSQGFTLSCDIYPDQQSTDWNYIFGIGTFGEEKNAFVGTIGFSAGFDSELKKDTDGTSWMGFPAGDAADPNNPNWIHENKGNYNWNFFMNPVNAHKWYHLDFIYSLEGLTIAIDGVPIVAYQDTNGYMADIFKALKDGQLRLGKGVVTSNEGYVGLMDNIELKTVSSEHEHVPGEGEGVIVTEPACTTAGVKRLPACTICGQVPMEIIPALGHDYGELVAATEATCSKTGMKEHYKCARCNGYGQMVSADDGTSKIEEVSRPTLVIDKIPHTYTTATTKATASANGVIKSVCGVCQHTETEVIYMASNITLAGTSFAHTGKEIRPAVTVKDSKGAVIAASNYTVGYSNNINPGTATATITFKGDKYAGSVRKSFTIAEAASLTLNKSKVTLYTGKASKTAAIKATVKGASKTVTWKTSNAKVAKVDKNGKITAVKAGKATITATANGISKKVTVTVKNPTITIKKGKKAVKKIDVKRKKSVKLTVSVNPKNSGIKVGKLTKKQKKIATVTFKKGKLTIKGKKKGTVKVKITSGKGTKTLTVKVK